MSIKIPKAILSMLLLYLTALSMPVFAENKSKTKMQVDTVLLNGKIYTQSIGQPTAEALAIENGVIVAVGKSKKIASMGNRQTKTIDLKGQAVLPGFHDLHVHPLFAGLREFECMIPQGSNQSTIQGIVAACVNDAEPGQWIYGGQWDASAIGKVPDRSILDAVAADHPVLLYDTSGHSAWANSKALELAGVDKNTADLPGGIIERDTGGAPTGVLRELAIELVRRHMPPHSEKTIRRALKWSLNKMLSHGITSFTEASVGFSAGLEREAKLYASFADEGLLKQRTTLCLNWHPLHPGIEPFLAKRNLYARQRVFPDCIKIFLDGVPTDSHTAAMLEPYAGKIKGRDDEASRRGLLLIQQDTLDAAVTRFDSMGMTVKFHAAGDAAVRAGLKAIATARKANGFSSQMHNVGHCTFVAKEDMSFARDIGATFEVSPYLWSPSPINDSITSAIGEERIKRVWPIRDIIESGALAVPGSDWAVVPSVNPWIAIEALITREQPGGSEKSFGKGQAISLEQAIRLFTINSAIQESMSDKVGRIEAGMLADIIVLDQDPYKVPVNQLHKTEVRMTFINGEKVFDISKTKK